MVTPRRQCETCYVDNQGRCHHCGTPMNLDWMIHYYGETKARQIWNDWKETKK